MAYASAYKYLSTGLNATLIREGVSVGNTASYPRVQVHDITEQPPVDKGGSVRIVTAVIESISEVSPEEAEQMNSDNLALCATLPDSEAFHLVGLVPAQMTENTEESDTAPVLHHVLQTIDFYIQQL